MEGNLSKARTSLLTTAKGSSSIGEHKQAGVLYHSISQGGDGRLSQVSNVRNSKPSYPLTKDVSQTHIRNLSETSVPSACARYPKPPEVRSASAMEYGYGDTSIDYQGSNGTPNWNSPTPSRSRNTPSTALQEEESSPSTDLTPPDATKSQGLGIRNHIFHSRNTSKDSGYGLTRSQSQISTQGLRDQMNDLSSKIADLRADQQANRFRRNSLQALRPPSSTAAAEEWYLGATECKIGENSLSTNAGMGWRSKKDPVEISAKPTKSPWSPQSPRPPRSPNCSNESAVEETQMDLIPAENHGQDLHPHSSTPTQPPTLKAVNSDQSDQGDQDSYIDESHYVKALEGRSHTAEDTVAASEEEQIYLNEVLEESLQDAEPEIPLSPDVVQIVESERHEDRADAFDYENFFLHSALGNYSQAGFHRRNVSQATAESRMSFESSDSVETTRAPQSENTGTIPEQGMEDKEAIGSDWTGGDAFCPDEAPTPTALNPPNAQHHLRSNSIDSVSSAATFATATEGGNDSESETDTVPSEILHWGERPVASNIVGAWPSPAASPPRGLANLTNGHASSLGTHAPQAQNSMPSSDAIPSPPTTSPLQPTEGGQDDGESEGDDDSQRQPPNTEILISALITLANPGFKPSGPFSEVDKDLVVNVLRSVGAVCEGINASDSRGQVYESRIWRRRLDTARRILEGEIEVEDD